MQTSSDNDDSNRTDDQALVSEAAYVVVEASAVSREAIEYSGLVRIESGLIAASQGMPVSTPSVPGVPNEPAGSAGLDDLLSAAQSVVDIASELLASGELTAAQQATITTVHDTAEPLPGLIQQTIELGDDDGPSPGAAAGNAPSAQPSGGGASTLP